MEIRLDQISERPFTWSETRHVPSEALERPEVVGLSEVSWSGELAPLSTGYLFKARLSYEQTLACPRCLGGSTQPVTAEVELLILRDASQPTVGEYELSESDLSVLYVEGEVLDTQPILLEQLQLNVPMRPLCRDDCAGLCPVCGADLNQGACGCSDNPPDPRWSALEALRDRLKD